MSELINDRALELCAAWNEQRAAAVMHWAIADRLTLFGLKSDPSFEPTIRAARQWADAAAETMRALEQEPPRTALGASEMLKVAVSVLQERADDPDVVLAQADLLALLRNVAAEVSYLETAPIGAAGHKQRDFAKQQQPQAAHAA